MNDDTLISVITPCFNGMPYITEAIESVRSQPYQNVEHIVVDGGSTDGTTEILDQYPDIRYISEPDDGIYDALNKALEMARGDLIGWLNADDKYAENVFERIAECARENPSCDLIAGNCSVFEVENGTEREVQTMEFSEREAFSKGEIAHSDVLLNGCMLSSDLMSSLGNFDDKLVIGGDRDYLIRIAASKPDIVRLHETVYRFRMHEDSLTYSPDEGRNDAWKPGAEDSMRYLPRYMSKPGTPDALMDYCRFHFRQRAGRLLRHYLSNRDVENAGRIFRTIIRTDPGWYLWALRKIITRPSALREP